MKSGVRDRPGGRGEDCGDKIFTVTWTLWVKSSRRESVGRNFMNFDVAKLINFSGTVFYSGLWDNVVVRFENLNIC